MIAPGAADVRSSWRDAAASLLRATGDTRVADLVQRAKVEVSDHQETWEMGERTVDALRLALIVDASAYVHFRTEPFALDHAKEAFAAAVRSFETELAELLIFLDIDIG